MEAPVVGEEGESNRENERRWENRRSRERDQVKLEGFPMMLPCKDLKSLTVRGTSQVAIEGRRRGAAGERLDGGRRAVVQTRKGYMNF